jgi:membrane protein
MKESAALSYYTVLATGPLVLLSFYLLVKIEHQRFNKILPQMEDFFGPEVTNMFKTIVLTAVHNQVFFQTSYKVLGIIILMISASSMFSQVNQLVYKIFNGDRVLNRKETLMLWVKHRLLAVGILMVVMMALIGSFTVAFFKNFIITLNQTHNYWLLQSLFFVFLAFVFSGIFAFFKSSLHSRRDCLVGGTFTAAGFTIGKAVITLYIKSSLVGSVYGVGSSIILLLVWSYYSSLIFFTGALLTSLIPEIKKIKS